MRPSATIWATAARLLIARLAPLVLVLALVACGSDVSSSSENYSPDARNTARNPTSPATSSPTPSPAAGDAGPAIIGGTLEAFEAKFGAPNDHSDPSVFMYHFWRCGQALDCVIVTTDYLDGATAALAHRIIHVIVAHPDSSGPWTKSEAEAYCRTFAPNDLRYVKTIPDVSGGTGYDIVYYSPTLAKIFPAKDFTDTNNNVTQDGSLDIEYLYAGDNPDQIDSCDLVIGIQPSL